MELISISALILASGFWGLVSFATLFLLCIILCGVDDRDPTFGGWVSFSGLALMVFFAWLLKDNTLGFLTTWQFWRPVTEYLCIGFGYFGFKFIHMLLKARSNLPEMWKKYVEENFTKEEKKAILSSENFSSISTDVVTRIYSSMYHFSHQVQRKFLILAVKQIEYDAEYRGPQIELNSVRLARHMTSWTLLWPAYLISTLIFDILVEGFTHLSNFIKYALGGFITKFFSGIFDNKA